jgi:hypothetical protein
MAKFVDDSVGAFCDAVQSFLEWTAAIFMTTNFGLLLGMSISHGEVAALDELFFVWVFLPVAWLVSMRVAVAIGVTAVAWYLPLKIESTRLMIAALCVNFATWLGMSVSIGWL